MEKSRKVRPLLAGVATLALAGGFLCGGVAWAGPRVPQTAYTGYSAADTRLVKAMDGVNGSVQAKSDADALAAQAAQQAQQNAANSQQGSGSPGNGGNVAGGGQRSYGGYTASQGRGGSGYAAPQQHYQAPSAPVQRPAPAPAPSPAAPPSSHNMCITIPMGDGSIFHQCNYM